MKKMIISLVLAGIMCPLAACGASDTDMEAAITAPVTEEQTENRIPETAAFEILPEEANGVFNHVITAAKNTYPLADGAKRQYGYKGKDIINGEECYLFSVYDSDDNGKSFKIAEIAGSVNGSSVYTLNSETSVFEELELTKAVQSSWSSKGSLKTVKVKMQSATRLAAESLKA